MQPDIEATVIALARERYNFQPKSIDEMWRILYENAVFIERIDLGVIDDNGHRSCE